MNIKKIQLTITTVSTTTNISESSIVEIVEHGIVEPEGAHPHEWIFSEEMLYVLQRAKRLRYDLQLNWPGVALAFDLLKQIETLRDENSKLKENIESKDNEN